MQSWKDEMSNNLDRYRLTIRKIKNDINTKVELLEKNKAARDMTRKGLLLRYVYLQAMDVLILNLIIFTIER